MTEYEIHTALVQHLRLLANPEAVWFHVPNSPRNQIQGARLKRMGMLAGAPDLIFLHNGEAFALELKSAKGGLTDSQRYFRDRWTRSRRLLFCGKHAGRGHGVAKINGVS